MATARRLRAAGAATGWVTRRFVAIVAVVMAVLFEALLWDVTHQRFRPCAGSTEGRGCSGPELRHALRLSPLPWNRHEALFWLVNGVVLAAAAMTLVAFRLIRRRRRVSFLV